jgi:hypothetical protein
MPDPLETEVLAVLREACSGNTQLTRQLALLEPTRKLARLLVGTGLAHWKPLSVA